MNEEIYGKLKDIIKVYLPEDVALEAITPQSHLINELNINSANLIDIVLDVEDAFDITIADTELEQLDSVSSAIQIIESKIPNT